MTKSLSIEDDLEPLTVLEAEALCPEAFASLVCRGQMTDDNFVIRRSDDTLWWVVYLSTDRIGTVICLNTDHSGIFSALLWDSKVKKWKTC